MEPPSVARGAVRTATPSRWRTERRDFFAFRQNAAQLWAVRRPEADEGVCPRTSGARLRSRTHLVPAGSYGRPMHALPAPDLLGLFDGLRGITIL